MQEYKEVSFKQGKKKKNYKYKNKQNSCRINKTTNNVAETFRKGEKFPYLKNQKHLHIKFNSYGKNGKRSFKE
jgi:hypothetical protein